MTHITTACAADFPTGSKIMFKGAVYEVVARQTWDGLELREHKPEKKASKRCKPPMQHGPAKRKRW